MGCGCEKPRTKFAKTKGMTPKVLQINNPSEVIIFHKVNIPASMGDENDIFPENGLYRNTLLHYDANGHAYFYSSDGIPTLLNAGLTSFNDLSNRPTYADEIMTGDTNIPDVDAVRNDLTSAIETEAETRSTAVSTLTTNLENESTARTNSDSSINNRLDTEIVNRTSADTNLQAAINAEVAARQSSEATVTAAINQDTLVDAGINANLSTVNMTHTKKNLLTGATDTDVDAFPVASSTSAGIINAATYSNIQTLSDQVNAILSGSVAISGLPASPTQAQLTTAWESATDLDELINGAKINDSTNQKVWTYYTNTNTWYAATNTAQITVNTATNSSQGIVQGSATGNGKVFVESNGTMSLLGWDSLSSAVSSNTSNISSLQTTVAGKANSSDVPVISVTANDPGEGEPLAANHFIFVYSEE